MLELYQEAALTPLHLLLCIDQAKEAIKEAQRCDPDSVFTHFCVYKMAMLEHNVEKGTGEAVTFGCIAAFTSPAS